MQPVRELVYDVGLHDGADTAHYLSHGFRVVAIEANPAMVEHAAARFAGFIQSGRLTLLNLGIADNHGQAEFWVSSKSEWSSFDRTIAGRDGTEHHPVPVTTVPLGDILKRYGIPHYCKIDIEAHDSERHAYFQQARPLYSFWFNWHVCH